MKHGLICIVDSPMVSDSEMCCVMRFFCFVLFFENICWGHCVVSVRYISWGIDLSLSLSFNPQSQRWVIWWLINLQTPGCLVFQFFHSRCGGILKCAMFTFPWGESLLLFLLTPFPGGKGILSLFYGGWFPTRRTFNLSNGHTICLHEEGGGCDPVACRDQTYAMVSWTSLRPWMMALQVEHSPTLADLTPFPWDNTWELCWLKCLGTFWLPGYWSIH